MRLGGLDEVAVDLAAGRILGQVRRCARVMGEGRLRREGERAEAAGERCDVASVPQGRVTVGRRSGDGKQVRTNVQDGRRTSLDRFGRARSGQRILRRRNGPSEVAKTLFMWLASL